MSSKKPLPSLRRYLITWFTGCAILVVFAYTELLEYYVDLGVDIRTQSFLERTAMDYASSLEPQIPEGRNLASYESLADIPKEIREKFAVWNLQHGEVQRFVNLRFFDDDDLENRSYRVETADLCGAQTCELMFLYPHKLNDGNWLYLLQGVVGTDEIYEELEFTEQVAFVIGAFFTLILVVVSVLVVRAIIRPLRTLESWSGAQSAEHVDAELPELRFREFHTLADRFRGAFLRLREGVTREKLFLRHASHELRTPIAILSSNLELMDRLTDRPERSEEEHASFLRQYRAIEDVQLLIETLLWINRQSDQIPKSESVELRAELNEIIENYRYLLEAKSVELKLEGEIESIVAPIAAVRIVLSNLIRNAFQYTVEGVIRVEILPDRVIIENTNLHAADLHESGESDDDYGFGLGLELVDLICARFGWDSSSAVYESGRRSEVKFSR